MRWLPTKVKPPQKSLEMTKGKKYSNTLYVPSIDSFKWRIELDAVDVINRNLLEHIVEQKVNTTTGEIINEKPIQSNSLQIQFEEYHIHFAINKIFGAEYLVVLINSKLLEDEYLQGITLKNIEPLYNRIMKCNVFNISFEDFLSKGKVSDIDIKKDVELTKDDFKTIIRNLDRNTKAHKRRHHGANPFLTDSNLGIEWNTRERGTFTHPFLKFYHKGIEALCSKNKDFFARFIDVHSLENVVRIETTVKSFRELQKYGFKDSSLLDILKAPEEKLNEIITHSVTSNLEERLKDSTPIKSKSELSPTDMLVYVHLSNMIQNQKVSFERALEFTLGHYSDKQQKNRMKTKLTEIYNQQIRGQEFQKKVAKQSAFYSIIGWV